MTNIGAMLKSLQDPMGVPFYPLVFQVLLVITFALHIIFVNLVVGGVFMSVYGYFKKGGHYRPLAKSFAKATTINFSLLIVLGVAPLLFMQVIYDPFWYTSNVLSAAWMVGVVFALMAAFSFVYVFYLKITKERKHIGVWGVAAFLLIILVGVTMHAVSYQALFPEQWVRWYVGGSTADFSGTILHAFQLPRFLHFMVASFAITGIFMMVYSWYFKDRDDMDRSYLVWVGKAGAKMAVVFTVLQMAVGVWWLLSVPANFQFYKNPVFIAAGILAVVLLLVLIEAQSNPQRYALPTAGLALISVLGMTSAREALRVLYAGRYDYSVYSYKLNLSYGSTVLFAVTFLMGIVIVGYMLTVVFKMGRSSKPIDLSSLKLRTWSVYLMIAWVLMMIGIGVAIAS
ncbi:MAG: hypothetical protein M1491_01290 [Deltaproteobacteria bacterium]|nr:hypothetical protein [Deltaproteobacteria bacterium]MCL5276853.1 hypothetical protein [Deltaproteobacteria bacterium]